MSGDPKRRTAVITGASSGVGLSASLQLVAAGWNIVAIGRDEQRCLNAEHSIRGAAMEGARIVMLRGDLAVLAEVASMAERVIAERLPIHALLNNAGGVRSERAITPEGNEATFAGNHLGHFLLTRQLLPALRETAAANGAGTARVVNVSSEGHRTYDSIDWSDLQRMKHWVSGRNYSLAKLCNMLFTFELARREGPNGLVAHAMHPGEAATNFSSHAVLEMQAYMATLNMISPDVGGRTLAWLASSQEAGRATGGYFFDCHAVEPAPQARDGAAATRLWDESEALVNRAGFA